MKKMIRGTLLSVFILFFVVLLFGCTNYKPEIVLVTDIGNIDDKSFNQGAWEGIVAYAEENDLENKKDYTYKRPVKADSEAYIETIKASISNGAKIIVCPGYLFEGPVNALQTQYPDVKFILIDGSPANVENGELKNNVYSLFYKEEQAGYLAGYAAVKDGFRKLGFMGGMAVPAVVRFGHGYMVGANDAAVELGLADGAIDMQYLYTGDFADTPEVTAKAAALYSNGTEVIFACGGPVTYSVKKAAEESQTPGKKVIGVDSDQNHLGDVMLTSSTKALQVTVKAALEGIRDGQWDANFGGKSVNLGAESDAVALPMATSRFKTFDKAAYKTVYDKLAKGEITIFVSTLETEKAAYDEVKTHTPKLVGEFVNFK